MNQDHPLNLLWTSYLVSEWVFCFVKYVAQIGVVILSQDFGVGVVGMERKWVMGLAGVEEGESQSENLWPGRRED